MIKAIECVVCIALMSLALVGCAPHGQVGINDVPTKGWSSPTQISITNSDTISQRQIIILVRHNNSIEGDSISVELKAMSPDSITYSEQLTLRLDKGQLSSASRTLSEIPYRSARLDQSGTYHFTIEPQHPINGVGAVGINIKKEIQ